MVDETFEVDREFLFIGRSFEEYLALFGLGRTFHEVALREIFQMTSGEVRIFPLVCLLPPIIIISEYLGLEVIRYRQQNTVY